MYKIYFKRLFDLVASIFLILFLFPLIIFIFFLVLFKIGFPIFSQKRVGMKNKIFTIYKFKTLFDGRGKISEKKRQSYLGNFLRKSGLDELPQLFNVLNNTMSLVGPRPLLVEYLKKYSNYEKKRHIVKPGITGLAQVNPNPLGIKSWKKSIKLDIYYVSNLSLILDVKILLKTVQLIFSMKKQFNDFKKFYE